MNTKKLVSYFLSGLLFLIPIFIIIQVIKGVSWFVTTFVDLPLYIAFPISFISIFLIGFILRRVLRKTTKKHIRKLAKRKSPMGFVAKIFTSFGLLSNQVSKAFHHPVLYKVDDGIYKLGFITDESEHMLEENIPVDHHDTEATPIAGSVWVYAPYPVTFSGELILVERRKIQLLDKEDTESVPLFVLSAGILKK